MDLEYINIIQESCEEMAAIFDYDNNYTLAKPYLQEAEEQKEGLIKRGIGAIIRFAKKIYGWFKEKIEYVINTIRKKFFNNNKTVADQAEKMLMIEERKATGGSSSTAEPSSQASTSSQAKSEPASTPKAEPKQIAAPKQLSKERKAIFDTIRQMIKHLKSESPEKMYMVEFGPYRSKFSEEEKSMDTYDFTFGTDDATGILIKTANIVSDIEFKVENIIQGTRALDKFYKYNSASTKEGKKIFMNTIIKQYFDKGTETLLSKPLEKTKDDCFKVLTRTASMCSEKDRILGKFDTNDLNKLSSMLSKGLKKNNMHDKEVLKRAHDGLLKAFQMKQVVFNKITQILNVAAQQFTISTKKCIGLLFQLSRKS